MNFNQLVLMGRLVRDVELRYLPKGIAVGQFSVAVNRVWKSEAGEKKEEVCFVDVTAWGNQAETLSKYLKKGDPIHLVGRLRTETWDDKQTGKKRSKLGVVLESFQFIGGGKKAEGEPGPDRTIDKADVPKAAGESEAPDGDSIPF